MVVPDARRKRRMRAICGLVRRDAWAGGGMQGHLWPCAERCLGRRRDAGPSAALCGKMLGPEAGCRAICGLVRKDAWAGGGMQGHLRPCAERCLGRRRDAGPSAALCGKMLGAEAGCRAICGLVRKDAWGGAPRTVEASTIRRVMPVKRRKFDADFREGAVRLVRETGKPIAAIARDLGVNEGTLGNWVVKDKAAREGVEGLSHDDAAELKRLRAEVAELRMERDVLKRSVVLWVKEATR